MSWVRLDDAFPDHPKIVKMAPAVVPFVLALQVRACCYASRHMTDGHLPVGQVAALISGFPAPPMLFDDWPALMVAAGLWETTDDGFLVHDFLEYNPSKASVYAKRQHARSAGQAGGRASAQANRRASAQAPAQATAQAKTKLLPPSPEDKEKTPLGASAQASAQADASTAPKGSHVYPCYHLLDPNSLDSYCNAKPTWRVNGDWLCEQHLPVDHPLHTVLNDGLLT